MNKIIYSLFILFTINHCANAEAFNSTNYSDIGVFYSNTTFPQSVVKRNENTTLPDDLSKFKKGEAASHNFFNLIDIGNAGIDAAAKNGNIKKTLEINYKEPNALKTIAANECESVPYEIPQLPLKTENTPEAIYQQVDLSDPNRKKIPLTLNTIVQEYAPLVIREISFNSDLAQILVKIKDWRGQLLYVYAILDDPYAFGYSVPDDTSFIYNIQHHDQYTLWRDGAVFGDINPILIIQMDGLRDLIDKEKKNYYGIYKSDFQPDEYILQAFRWQEYPTAYQKHSNQDACGCTCGNRYTGHQQEQDVSLPSGVFLSGKVPVAVV